jgi:hypothetical protein
VFAQWLEHRQPPEAVAVAWPPLHVPHFFVRRRQASFFNHATVKPMFAVTNVSLAVPRKRIGKRRNCSSSTQPNGADAGLVVVAETLRPPSLTRYNI